MNIQKVKLSEIKSNPNNPRIIKDDKFHKLVKSIKEFPKMLEIRPIVVNQDMIVLGGNMRLKASKEAGLKEVFIVKADDLTEEEQKQFIIKDNVGFGEWDWEMLANEWEAEELAEWGLDVPELTITEEPAAEEDDYEMPDEIQTDIVPGDLLEIGHHRLLCGDSTDSNSVEKLMDGEKADMAHNDPPYGMKKEKDGVLNDNLNYDDLLDFNREWIALQFMHLKENGSWYCWGIDEPLMDIYSEILKPYIKEEKATFRNLLTWDKGHGQSQNSELTRSFATADEKCLFIMLGVQGFNNNADNYFEGFETIRLWLDGQRKDSGLTTDECNRICGKKNMTQSAFTRGGFRLILEDDYLKLREATGNKYFLREYDEIKKEYEKIKQEYNSSRAYFNNTHDNMNNVWHFSRHFKDGSEGGHATPKPIPLCERAIKSSCPDKGLVLDFFLGSGSTMVAAHQLKRKCYGMELDPKYCQVIVDRMKKLDPTLVIKKNGIQI